MKTSMAAVLLLAAMIPALSHADQYSFTVLTPGGGPSTLDVALGINNEGQVVGYTGSSPSGFEYTGGSYSAIAVPLGTTGGAFTTYATSINNNGEIAGMASIGNAGGGFQAGSYGFTYQSNVYTTPFYVTLPPNGYPNTGVNSINDSGQLAGDFVDASGVTNGYLKTGNAITLISDPLAVAGSTSVSGLNNSGQMVGSYTSTSGNASGFFYSAGKWVSLNDPNSTGGTYASGINNVGEIVGSYVTGNSTSGFLYNIATGAYTTIDANIAGQTAFGTVIRGINDNGELVGTYTTGGFLNGGSFIAALTPVPLPTSVWLLGSAVAWWGFASRRNKERALASQGVI